MCFLIVVNYKNFFSFFFFRPLGILLHYFSVQALYPEPRTRLYEIRIEIYPIIVFVLFIILVCGSKYFEFGSGSRILAQFGFRIHCYVINFEKVLKY